MQNITKESFYDYLNEESEKFCKAYLDLNSTSNSELSCLVNSLSAETLDCEFNFDNSSGLLKIHRNLNSGYNHHIQEVEINENGFARFKEIFSEHLKILCIKIDILKYIRSFNDYKKFTFDESARNYKNNELKLELDPTQSFHTNLIINKIHENLQEKCELRIELSHDSDENIKNLGKFLDSYSSERIKLNGFSTFDALQKNI